MADQTTQKKKVVFSVINTTKEKILSANDIVNGRLAISSDTKEIFVGNGSKFVQTATNRFETLPQAEAAWSGVVLQYIGNSTTSLVKDGFYKCELQKDGTYKWVQQLFIPVGDTSKLDKKFFVDNDRSKGLLTFSEILTVLDKPYKILTAVKTTTTADGGIHFDTGVKFDTSYTYAITAKIWKVYGNNNCIMGAKTSSDLVVNSIGSGTVNWSFGGRTSSKTIANLVGKKVSITINKTSYTVVGDVSTSGSFSSVSNYQINYSVYYGAINYSGTTRDCTNLEFYGASIKDSTGTLIRDFIPCQLIRNILAAEASDNKAHNAGEIGIWDCVNNKFYAPTGSGSIAAL